MSDSRFFRRYLDILDEEPPTTMSTNVDGVDLTANAADKTVSAATSANNVDYKATTSTIPGGGSSVSASSQVAPNLKMTGTVTQPNYNAGQVAGTKSISGQYTDTSGKTQTATATQGVGFGGASGANVGKNVVTTYNKT
jgi:hypothetical protein